MGTSTIYDGPKDRNPLLPEGFEEEYDSSPPEEASENRNQEENPWQATKTAMSKFVTGKSSNRGRITRNYVKALGGPRNAAMSSKSGTISTVRLGQILSGIITEGIEATFNKLKISYKGKSVESLFSELVNVISTSSNLKEDGIAKNATVEALAQLYDFVEENGMEIQALDKMDETLFNKVMSAFISNYLFERLLKDLQSRFEKYAKNVLEALGKEYEIKEYINEAVEVKLRETAFNQIDYRNKNIDSIIEVIYRDCYEVLEGYL